MKLVHIFVTFALIFATQFYCTSAFSSELKTDSLEDLNNSGSGIPEEFYKDGTKDSNFQIEPESESGEIIENRSLLTPNLICKKGWKRLGGRCKRITTAASKNE